MGEDLLHDALFHCSVYDVLFKPTAFTVGSVIKNPKLTVKLSIDTTHRKLENLTFYAFIGWT